MKASCPNYAEFMPPQASWLGRRALSSSTCSQRGWFSNHVLLFLRHSDLNGCRYYNLENWSRLSGTFLWSDSRMLFPSCKTWSLKIEAASEFQWLHVIRVVCTVDSFITHTLRGQHWQGMRSNFWCDSVDPNMGCRRYYWLRGSGWESTIDMRVSTQSFKCPNSNVK